MYIYIHMYNCNVCKQSNDAKANIAVSAVVIFFTKPTNAAAGQCLYRTYYTRITAHGFLVSAAILGYSFSTRMVGFAA